MGAYDDLSALGTGGIIRAFPDLRAGDVIKIVADLIPDADVGRSVVLRRIDIDDIEIAVTEAGGDPAATGDVLTMVSDVQETEVTLRVTSGQGED